MNTIKIIIILQETPYSGGRRKIVWGLYGYGVVWHLSEAPSSLKKIKQAGNSKQANASEQKQASQSASQQASSEKQEKNSEQAIKQASKQKQASQGKTS